MLRRKLATLLGVLVCAAVPLAAQRPASDEQTIEEIRQAVLKLPYYGAFD